MLDRLLANPTLVALIGAMIAAVALAWNRYDSQNDRIARLRRGKRDHDR
ncbi:MAG: hypothetical protein K0Q72_4430 [Armatimonadetes bacterium]|jgi:hypothetical protein|nr:hypothetical protein [Armatimonadota bacterium]